MYSLDINFLRDRSDYKPDLVKKPAGGSSAAAQSSQDQTPVLAGLGVAFVINAVVLGVWFWLQGSNQQLQNQLAQLEAQQSELDAQVQQISDLNQRATEITRDANALATVFDQIKPWSALYQEFISKMPPGVNITDVLQKEPTAAEIAAVIPPPSPDAAAPTEPPPEGAEATPTEPPGADIIPPTATLTIAGRANSFGELNDFLLLLQRSPFLERAKTRLLTAELKENPDRLEYPPGREGPPLPELKPIVEYRIETQLSQVGASQILADMRNKGASGLVERIQTLQNEGVIE